MPYTDLDGYDVYNDMMANGGPGLHERRRSYPMGRSLDSERDVTVKAVNGRGFQTELGDWVNWSKFARPEMVRMPLVGDTVRLLIDKAGYIRKISGETGNPWTTPAAALTGPRTALVAPLVAVAPTETTPEPTPSAEPPAFVGRIEQDARGVVISRLACLNTATAILSSGGRQAVEADVLALSAHLEAWATR